MKISKITKNKTKQNIDTKISTNIPSVGFCDVIMTRTLTKINKFGFLYKSIGKIGFWLQFLPKTHFDRDILLKYERKW